MAAEVACVPVSGYRKGKIHSASEVRIGKREVLHSEL